jgi:hypothetical protein
MKRRTSRKRMEEHVADSWLVHDSTEAIDWPSRWPSCAASRRSRPPRRSDKFPPQTIDRRFVCPVFRAPSGVFGATMAGTGKVREADVWKAGRRCRLSVAPSQPLEPQQVERRTGSSILE